ncbi:MAG: methyltransferase [Candidatus Aenigmarchaeota archaeon]|nr:methyltransferase [Candidatus Aenigmarchaeota archaeon]
MEQKRFRNVVYPPSEDSFLIESCIDCHVGERVLDMGTGSGILAKKAASLGGKVTAVDINPEAVAAAKAIGIEAIQSDLFENVSGMFNLIIFNPPYLPENPSDMESMQWASGATNATIRRFLSGAKEHLLPKGRILILVSSLTDFEKLPELKAYGKKKVAGEKLFFEKLDVWELKVI